MLEWKVNERTDHTDESLDDTTHGGKVWRDVAMIQTQRALVEAQRRTAEQLHKIAVTLDVILDLTIDNVTKSSRTQALPESLAKVVQLRQSEQERKRG